MSNIIKATTPQSISFSTIGLFTGRIAAGKLPTNTPLVVRAVGTLSLQAGTFGYVDSNLFAGIAGFTPGAVSAGTSGGHVGAADLNANIPWSILASCYCDGFQGRILDTKVPASAITKPTLSSGSVFGDAPANLGTISPAGDGTLNFGVSNIEFVAGISFVPDGTSVGNVIAELLDFSLSIS